MALNSYGDLVSTVTDWLDDSELADRTADFVALAEARFNRVLRLPQMEAAATITLAANAGTTTIPGLLSLKAMYVAGDISTPSRPLEQTTLVNLIERYGNASGYPEACAISGTTLYVAPVPRELMTLKIVFYDAVPELTPANPTNWLLSMHPDLYLWGTLAAAEMRGWNDERLPLLKAALDETLAEIQTAGIKRQWGATPLKPMTGMCQTAGPRF